MAKSNFIVRGGGDFSKLYKELNAAQKKINNFKSGIGKTLKGVGALFGGIALGKTIKDFVSTAARTETLGVAMNSVARASGYATDVLNEHKKAVMDMGIAEQESMQILTRFMQAQLDTADASKLARVAQDAAVIANMNSSEAAEQMTEAIAKQRPILLSQFGMTKNLNEIYKEYAATLGKSSTQLDTSEKKQAMLNYILEEGNKIAGTYEASMGAVGKQIGSLPRYWQTLQNVLATPLALPGLSVAVEAITNALKNAINWAERNQITLQYWGQVVAGVVGNVVGVFRWLTKTIADNWNMIKILGTAILSYVTMTRIASFMTNHWQTVSLLLRSELQKKIGILGVLSQAIGIYRVQMAIAPAATNLFTGALIKLRAALYAVHTALGPVGWAILAISAALTGGMALWSKYSNSIIKSNQPLSSYSDSMKAANDAIKSMGNSGANAGKGQNKLADGIKKAEKAAKGSLAGFDEINQLQESMSKAGDAGAGDIPEVSMPSIPDVPDIGGIGGMLDDIEMAKPTLKGFWEWIKQGAGNLWDKVKEKWSQFIEWVKGWAIWDWLKGKWTQFRDWVSKLWDKVKESWNKLISWVRGWKIWGWLAEKFSLIKTTAENLWNTVKTKWNDFVGWFKGKFESAWTNIKNIFSGVKSFFSEKYEDIKNVFTSVGGWFKDKFESAWGGITNAFKSVKSWATEKWNDVKNVFKAVPNWFKDTFTNAWENVKNVFSKGGKIFTGIKDGIASTFKTVVNGLIGGINRIIRIPFNAINNMLNKIRNIGIFNLKPFQNLWGYNPLKVPQIPRLAKGGITDGPMLAMVGDNPGGREVVSPLDDLLSMMIKAINIADRHNGENTPIELTINFGSTRIYKEIINGINTVNRQAGRNTINI